MGRRQRPPGKPAAKTEDASAASSAAQALAEHMLAVHAIGLVRKFVEVNCDDLDIVSHTYAYAFHLHKHRVDTSTARLWDRVAEQTAARYSHREGDTGTHPLIAVLTVFRRIIMEFPQDYPNVAECFTRMFPFILSVGRVWELPPPPVFSQELFEDSAVQLTGAMRNYVDTASTVMRKRMRVLGFNVPLEPSAAIVLNPERALTMHMETGIDISVVPQRTPEEQRTSEEQPTTEEQRTTAEQRTTEEQPSANFVPFSGVGNKIGEDTEDGPAPQVVVSSMTEKETETHKEKLMNDLKDVMESMREGVKTMEQLKKDGDALAEMMRQRVSFDTLFMPIIFRSSFGELTDQQWQGLTEHVVGEMQEWAQDEGNSLALGYLERGGESSSESDSNEKLKQEAMRCLDALCDKDLETLQQELARRGLLLQRSSETADNSQLELTRTVAVDMLCRVREENAALKNVIEAQNGEINQLKTETAELQRTVVSLAKRLG